LVGRPTSPLLSRSDETFNIICPFEKDIVVDIDKQLSKIKSERVGLEKQLDKVTPLSVTDSMTGAYVVGEDTVYMTSLNFKTDTTDISINAVDIVDTQLEQSSYFDFATEGVMITAEELDFL
jgi:hypothetical protein